MEQRIIITPDTVQREVELAPGTVNVEERDVESYLKEIGKRAPIETGILPPGVLSIRQAGDHLQIVHQTVPGVNYVNWGAYERDSSAKTYTLAQPYQIAVGDFVNGDLLGCRIFYSPVPITSLDQPLYHQNVPNINCKGYGQGYGGALGNGVGWVCLYHRESWKTMDIAQKTARMIERCSGVETYNDANMSETDGTRFYKQHKKPEYLWNPKVWEEKSEKEGFEWTLDPKLWIPVLVKDQDHQDKHYADGVPLTLRMAMEGNASAYYGDKYLPKPINGLARADQKLIPKDIHQKVYNEAFVNAKVTKAATAKKQPVAKVAKPIVAAPKVQLKKPIVKKLPVEKPTGWSNVLVATENCEACGIATHPNWVLTVNDNSHYFCEEHYSYVTMCAACKKISQISDTMISADGQNVCLNCAEDSKCIKCGMVYTWHEGQLKICTKCYKAEQLV